MIYLLPLVSLVFLVSAIRVEGSYKGFKIEIDDKTKWSTVLKFVVILILVVAGIKWMMQK